MSSLIYNVLIYFDNNVDVLEVSVAAYWTLTKSLLFMVSMSLREMESTEVVNEAVSVWVTPQLSGVNLNMSARWQLGATDTFEPVTVEVVEYIANYNDSQGKYVSTGSRHSINNEDVTYSWTVQDIAELGCVLFKANRASVSGYNSVSAATSFFTYIQTADI